jgi:succinoglycan biosynthesis transport protein ExoP
MTVQLFLAICRARMGLAMAVLLVTVAFTIGTGLILPKKYTATASLIIDLGKPDPLANAVYWSAPSLAYLATQTDIIRSDRVAVAAVRKLKLADNPTMHQKWQEVSKGRGAIDVWIAHDLQKTMEVTPARDSNVISIAVEAGDPEFAARWANALAQSYIDESVRLRADPARQFSAFFESQAADLRKKVERAQAKLSAFQRERGVVITDDRIDSEVARLNELSSQLIQIQSIAAESGSRQMAAEGRNADRLQEVTNNPVLASMRSELTFAEAHLQELSSRKGDKHPDVLQAKASIAVLRSRLDNETRRITGSVGVTNSINQQREAAVRNALEAQRARLLRIKMVREEGMLLLRDVESAQRAYDGVVSRLSQSTLESHATQTNAALLSEASPPLYPSSSRLLVNAALSVVVGLVLAIGSVMLLEWLDGRVRTAEMGASLLGIPVLGTLSEPQGKGNYAARRIPLVAPRIANRLQAPSSKG